MQKIKGIFKNHRLRAIVLIAVIAVAGLATLQQVSKNQDLRQRASSDVGLEFNLPSTEVGLGQQFDTVVVLNNSAGKPITSFDVTISYDSKAISYIGSSVIYPFTGLITTSTPESGKVRIAGTIEGNSTLPDMGNYSYAKIANITFVGKSLSSSTIGFSNANIAALDEAKSVVNWIKNSPITVAKNPPSITPAPSQYCKKGINTFSATQDGCKSGSYKTILIGCYDNFTTTVSTPSCTGYEEMMKYASQFCEGRTSCSPQTTVTPTPPITCDIDQNGTVNQADYSMLVACAQENTITDKCKKVDFNKDGKVNLDDLNIFLRQCPMLTPPPPTGTPTPTWLSTPTPSRIPTPTPGNYGYVYIATTPDAQSIRLLTTSGKLITQSTGKISQQLTVGNYYAYFSISNRKTKSSKVPVTKTFTVKKGQTTTIIGDFSTGKTTVTTR
ncbi:MAG: hypothetical protein E6P95_01410 [Candidatus Moraniibacteriota bacterium]|jgi:hypothetical protein|nr:MAG: hypothetical protein E6P95_01410 [Candidatus Moranbacteria bacterium]